MADNIPPHTPSVPTGAVPPPKKETGKVQPKKETVRINLPPRPTAAPTIKLPTLPPGGPTGAPTAAHLAAPAPAPAPAPANRLATAPAAAPAAAPRPGAAAPKPGQRTAPAAQRPAVPAAADAIQPLDKILIYAAAVAGVIAVAGGVWVFLTLKNTVETFTT